MNTTFRTVFYFFNCKIIGNIGESLIHLGNNASKSYIFLDGLDVHNNNSKVIVAENGNIKESNSKYYENKSIRGTILQISFESEVRFDNT